MHVGLRHAVTAILLGVGVYSLAFGNPIATRWLAAKFILVAILIAIGSVLRVIVGSWVRDLTGVAGSEGAIAAQLSVYPQAGDHLLAGVDFCRLSRRDEILLDLHDRFDHTAGSAERCAGNAVDHGWLHRPFNGRGEERGRLVDVGFDQLQEAAG